MSTEQTADPINVSTGCSTLGAGKIARQWLLKHAAERLGPSELAARLKVTEPLLQAWITGHFDMPDRKTLLLVDVIDDWDKPK